MKTYNLKTVRASKVVIIDGHGYASRAHGPGQRFVLRMGKQKVRLHDGATPLGAFALDQPTHFSTPQIHPTEAIVAVLMEDRTRVEFRDFDGTLLHHFKLPAAYGAGFGFLEDGTFLYMGPTKPGATWENQDFGFVMWSAGQPLHALGDFARAQDFKLFPDAPGDDANVDPFHQPGTALCGFPCGHSGTTDFHLVNTTGGHLEIGPPIGWLPYGLAFSPDAAEFVVACQSPPNAELCQFRRFDYRQRVPPDRAAPDGYLPAFKVLEKPLRWPDIKFDGDDTDYPTDSFYLGHDRSIHASAYGRMFVLNTREMKLEGELQIDGFELRPAGKNGWPRSAPYSGQIQLLQLDDHLLALYPSGEGKKARLRLVFVDRDAVCEAFA